MKKNILALSFAFLASFNLFSQKIINDENYAEYTLENGIEVFILEDFSSAEINIELSVRAGFNSQNEENTGFFTLYSNLFKYGKTSEDEIKNISSECASDESRYRISVTQNEFEKTLENLSIHAFSPYFSDEAIKAEYDSLKEEILTYAETPVFFLNSAIDSRVFSKEPWKQDSGVYPSLFKDKSVEEIRTILKSISDSWYTTQNSSLFISGCIKKEKTLEIVKKYFSKINPSSSSLKAEKGKAGGKNKKFVIVSKDFSKSLNQIVVQFTSLNIEEADIASFALNENNSSMKKLLLKQRNLSLREAEYVNVSAAHKNGTSRLIIQALMEEPFNKKVNLLTQAELFISKMKEGVLNTTEEEFSGAKKNAIESFNLISENSSTFMDYLSQFRAVQDFSEANAKHLKIAERLYEEPTLIRETKNETIKERIKNEEPFVFVLLNQDVFEKNKKAFEKAGYIKIDSKNASWFSNELYKNIEKEKQKSENPQIVQEENEGDFENKDIFFIRKNRESIKQIELENKIPVTIKRTETTGNVLIMLSLTLGKFSFPENPGFEKIITQAFATNIQKEISKYRKENVLESSPEITSETFNSYTAVTVECAKEDAAICLKVISDALIFSEILPSEADSYVYAIQTQKRLYNASSVNQLSYRALRWLFPNGTIRKVLSTDTDILQNTNYNQILAAYPSLLDSKLYRIVIVGNIDWEYLYEPLKNTLGLLSEQKTEIRKTELEKIDFPEEQKVFVKLKHVFTTDIKAEDAGPMPKVLVPTENFKDPVQFWFSSPENTENKKDIVLYDALFFRFKEFLEENLNSESKTSGEELSSEIRTFLRTKEIPSSSYTFMNVSHTQKIDEFFKNSVLEYSKILSSDEKIDEEIEKIKSVWIKNALKGTKTNRGTAILIRNGEENPFEYLDEYESLLNANKEDAKRIFEEHFVQIPRLRLYSIESEK